jgi:hypothetical protein
LHDDRRIRIYTSDLWFRIREAQKHVDLVDPDPDPEHWFFVYQGQYLECLLPFINTCLIISVLFPAGLYHSAR